MRGNENGKKRERKRGRQERERCGVEKKERDGGGWEGTTKGREKVRREEVF